MLFRRSTFGNIGSRSLFRRYAGIYHSKGLCFWNLIFVLLLMDKLDYGYCMWQDLFKQASRLLISEEMVSYGSKRSEIGIIVQVWFLLPCGQWNLIMNGLPVWKNIFSSMQGMLLGLLLFPAVFKSLLQIWECSLSKYIGSRTNNEIWRSLIFFSSIAFIIIVVVPSWMLFVQDFNMHPLLWYC